MRNFLILRLNNLRVIKFFNFYGILKINQRKYKIPLLGKIGIHHLFGWEPWLDSILDKIIHLENGIFVDVGANIGQTLLKIKSISPTMEYVGIEPNPACVHYLNLLIKKNKLLKVDILPVAISKNNSIKELTLYNNNESDGAASLVPKFRPTNITYGKKSILALNMHMIRDLFEFKKISILKIDVEGMENIVLEEFKEEIKKDKPIILIEILPVYSKENIDRLLKQQAIERLIKKLHYFTYKLKLEKGALKEIIKINEIGIHSNINEVDYIFVPKEKASKFEYAFHLSTKRP